MNRKSEYARLMEQIRQAHQAFVTAWAESRDAALEKMPPREGALWEANGVAYKAAQPLADRRNELLAELFRDHLAPLYERFKSGDPDTVHAIIDFLEVDVPAFHCGYAKEHYLRKLKTIPLTDEHRERLREYGFRLCGAPHYRREIAEAGRLMIVVANQPFVDELRELSNSDNERITNKATKMLEVVLKGRKDLR
jgi:hypothetical protein